MKRSSKSYTLLLNPESELNYLPHWMKGASPTGKMTSMIKSLSNFHRESGPNKNPSQPSVLIPLDIMAKIEERLAKSRLQEAALEASEPKLVEQAVEQSIIPALKQKAPKIEMPPDSIAEVNEDSIEQPPFQQPLQDKPSVEPHVSVSEFVLEELETGEVEEKQISQQKRQEVSMGKEESKDNLNEKNSEEKERKTSTSTNLSNSNHKPSEAQRKSLRLSSRPIPSHTMASKKVPSKSERLLQRFGSKAGKFSQPTIPK